jgi:hypothetical protein
MMHTALLAGVSALLLTGSAALAQNTADPATGQGKVISPAGEAGGSAAGTTVGAGTPPAGAAAATTTGGAATADCPPAGAANAQGADRSAEVGNKPGC